MTQPDIRGGVAGWNAWRNANPSIVPNLTGALLAGANLTDADLTDADGIIDAGVTARNYLMVAVRHEYRLRLS